MKPKEFCFICDVYLCYFYLYVCLLRSLWLILSFLSSVLIKRELFENVCLCWLSQHINENIKDVWFLLLQNFYRLKTFDYLHWKNNLEWACTRLPIETSISIWAQAWFWLKREYAFKEIVRYTNNGISQYYHHIVLHSKWSSFISIICFFLIEYFHHITVTSMISSLQVSQNAIILRI